MTSQERNAMKIKRRTPKFKRRIRLRYIKNKKCPAGTTWSSKTRGCSKLNIDLSRIEKLISKMKLKG